jgi:hypothetical protein
MEHSNELPGCIKGSEFLHQVDGHKLLKKSVLCSCLFRYDSCRPTANRNGQTVGAKSIMQRVYKSRDICDMYACVVSALAAVDDRMMTNIQLQTLIE